VSTVYPPLKTETYDEGSFTAWVIRQLGGPQVDVEIDEAVVKDALLEALALYSKYKPQHITESWITPSGITRHVWTTKGVRGLYDIQITGIQEGLQAPNIEGQMLSGAFAYYGVRSPMYDIRYYEYLRQWAKIAARELSSEPDYKEDDDHSGIWIYAPGTEAKCYATLTKDHVVPDTVRSFDQSWMRQYVLAWIKANSLGRIRGKFAEILGAGKSMTLDGKELLAEGRTDLVSLEEHLKSTRTDLAPSWG